MKKYNKRQYDKDVARIKQEIQDVNDRIAELVAYNDGGGVLSDEQCKEWESLYDREYELAEELDDAERKYRRRNWTSYDYAMREMVAQNID